jgi:SPP1 gp7 family putative phage head morphogenesis protein
MCLNCQIINLSIPPLKLEAELKRIAKLIRDGKMRPNQIDAAMVKKIAKQLMEGVNQGYGTAATDVDISFLRQIENNVYVFSGFKNYQMLREASLLLTNDTGVLKPFNSFLNDVKAISKTYNEVYLNAEYGNAVASMQAAASWNDFIELGVDMLRFQSINDDRTRPEHAIMDGTTVPIGDPLLDTYFTPLDWGCRCEWVPAVGQSRVIKDLPTVPPMFQTNVAKTGILFPDTHPYFNVSPTTAKDILTQVDDVIGKK